MTSVPPGLARTYQVAAPKVGTQHAITGFELGVDQYATDWKTIAHPFGHRDQARGQYPHAERQNAPLRP